MVRLGVLDVGSNTIHLVAVDAYSGGRPTPMSDWKQPLRLVELLDKKGNIEDKGVDKLVDAVQEASDLAANLKCEELLAFATSAVRSATNSDEVLAAVTAKTGVDVTVLSGRDEARLTSLAVRRWYGWSAGRILALDIGGGSLEMSNGVDEEPDVALSVPLGAGRVTRDFVDHPGAVAVLALRGQAGAAGRHLPRRRRVRGLQVAGAPRALARRSPRPAAGRPRRGPRPAPAPPPAGVAA